MSLLINLLVSGIAVIIASYFTAGAHVDGYITAIIVAVVLAIVNSTIGLVLKILTFPLFVAHALPHQKIIIAKKLLV